MVNCDDRLLVLNEIISKHKPFNEGWWWNLKHKPPASITRDGGSGEWLVDGAPASEANIPTIIETVYHTIMDSVEASRIRLERDTLLLARRIAAASAMEHSLVTLGTEEVPADNRTDVSKE